EAAAVGAEGHGQDSAHGAVQAEVLVAGPGVPDLHLLVAMHRESAGARGAVASVGGERHPKAPIAEHGIPIGAGAAEGSLFLAGLRVPQLHCRTGGSEPPTVGAEPDAPYAIGKATQRTHLVTRVQVPDLHFPFLIGCPTARGDQALTVRAEAYTPHSDPAGVFHLKPGGLDVAPQDCLHIPNLDLPIPASRGEVPAVGAKHDAGGAGLVSQPFPEFLAGLGLPEPEDAGLSGSGQVLAVGGAERNAVDGAL